MKFFSVLVTFIFLIFTISGSLVSEKLSEKEKIQFLLDEIEKSGVIFVRNDEKHNSKEARSHMERKLGHAGNKIKTAEQFIDYLGTKSSMSGKVYYVIFPDGSKMESAKWLRTLLKKIEG